MDDGTRRRLGRGAYRYYGTRSGPFAMSSGNGRLIIASSHFHTGTFSPHYTSLLMIAGIIPLIWLVGWTYQYAKGLRGD